MRGSLAYTDESTGREAVLDNVGVSLRGNTSLQDGECSFPKLKIQLAHGGRPLWMENAFFLLRRHSNVYLDISGIPPRSLLKYFPRLEEIASKTLFGTDWPGPGVPDMKQNLDEFRALPLGPQVQEQILSKTAETIWPRG